LIALVLNAWFSSLMIDSQAESRLLRSDKSDRSSDSDWGNSMEEIDQRVPEKYRV
jgi:hypothetical protein